VSPGIAVVIPARGGSVRIPRKNVKTFNGRPIVSWALDSCAKNPAIQQVAVSTDDPEITAVGLAHGATTIIDRPADLATDTAGTAPVIRHAIDELRLSDDALVVCLYPTATLTQALVEEALDLARQHPDRFVVSVGRHRSPHERSVEPREAGLMALSSTEHLLTRTQDLPQRYFDAGKLYVAKASVWKARDTMMEVPFVPFHLPDWATVDIDEPEDWAIAEALHRVFVLETS
jgi:CMP-N-acetylneuraminic acid synthetase